MLRQQAEFLGPATVQGRLYAIGDYPGLILSGTVDGLVTGEVYRLRKPAQMLAVLDEYEGGDYERVLADAQLDSGETTGTWVYVYRLPVDEAKRIKSGDFLVL